MSAIVTKGREIADSKRHFLAFGLSMLSLAQGGNDEGIAVHSHAYEAVLKAHPDLSDEEIARQAFLVVAEVVAEEVIREEGWSAILIDFVLRHAGRLQEVRDGSI